MSNSHELANYLRQQGIHDEVVLAAIANTPRELFVDFPYQHSAYLDQPLPIACGQTISQPFIVALMTQELRQQQHLQRVLEIGTGSGYQAAILSQIATEVYTIERIKMLYNAAKTRLANYPNIQIKFADGTFGWVEAAPFDGIIVTAAAAQVPQALLEQLSEGGRLIIPVDAGFYQQLQIITRHGNNFIKQESAAVLFVPMLSGTEDE